MGISRLESCPWTMTDESLSVICVNKFCVNPRSPRYENHFDKLLVVFCEATRNICRCVDMFLTYLRGVITKVCPNVCSYLHGSSSMPCSPFLFFLGATKHLYNCLCPSVCRSVGWSVTHLFDDPHRRTYWPTWPCLVDTLLHRLFI